MKIIISESQEIDVKKKFIFMLLSNKNYNLVEIGDRIYFVKNIGDEKAEIRFDKSDGFCRISYNLISFLSSITGFQESEVKELIGKWVEHTLQMEVTYNQALRMAGFRLS
jgi:DnaJ-class molecular chaperone